LSLVGLSCRLCLDSQQRGEEKDGGCEEAEQSWSYCNRLPPKISTL
jgi:hypothetical protein